jgi:hypothetical protein
MSETTLDGRQQCVATKHDGGKCTRLALPKADVCEFHTEAHRAKARANGVRGGRRSGEKRRVLGAKCDLTTHSGKEAAVQTIFDGVRKGTINPQAATALIKCIDVALKLRAEEGREQEIAALHEQVTHALGARRLGNAPAALTAGQANGEEE